MLLYKLREPIPKFASDHITKFYPVGCLIINYFVNVNETNKLTFCLPEDPDLVERDRVNDGHDDDDTKRGVRYVVEQRRQECQCQ